MRLKKREVEALAAQGKGSMNNSIIPREREFPDKDQRVFIMEDHRKAAQGENSASESEKTRLG